MSLQDDLAEVLVHWTTEPEQAAAEVHGLLRRLNPSELLAEASWRPGPRFVRRHPNGDPVEEEL